jgi:hypothetical protein
MAGWGAKLPSKFGGFEFLHTQPTDKQHVFEVHFTASASVVKTYKDFVSCIVLSRQSSHFGEEWWRALSARVT